METLKTKAGTWYSLYRPTKQDIAWLGDTFRFHDVVLAELSRPTVRPKVQRFDHYLYLVLHFPIFNEREQKTYSREIDFIITKKGFLTIHYEPIPPLEEFFKRCATEKSCADLYASKTTMHLLYHLVKALYEFSLRELDHIQERIAQIEEEIFSGKEREVIAEVTVVGRDIIDFRRAIKPQQVTIESLTREGELLFGKEVTPFLEALSGEYQKLWSLLENHKETLDALYETNTTLLNIKQNDTMKTLTIMAFTTFPLTLLATLFAIDTASNPLIGRRFGFWIITGILLIGISVILGVFKKKKWL